MVQDPLVVVVCLLDSSCLFLFQILKMTGRPRLVDYTYTDGVVPESEPEEVCIDEPYRRLTLLFAGGQ